MASSNAPQIKITHENQENVEAQAQPAAAASKTITTKTVTTVEETITKQQQQQQIRESNKRNADRLNLVVVEDLGRQAEALEDLSRLLNSASSQSKTNQQQMTSKTMTRSKDSIEGNKLVTTISTIATISGQSSIVVALLKDGTRLHLKFQDMKPSIFEIGSNNSECLKYFEEHGRLIKSIGKLKKTPIDVWFEKFDKIKKEKEPNMSADRKQVYACMIENLQLCWRSLLEQLQLIRGQMLQESCKFYAQCDEKLAKSIDKAEQHVEQFRQEFLNGLKNESSFQEAFAELKRLNSTVAEEYDSAKLQRSRLIELIKDIAQNNLGDLRANLLIDDGQNLINYIENYLEPYERRKLQLESVLTTTSSTTTTTTAKTTNSSSLLSEVQPTASNNYSSLNMVARQNYIREINNFNDLNLVENWLNLKIEQINSSLLSSLGVSQVDSKSILGKHEQIALECNAIEEATLSFKGKNIHAVRDVDQATLGKLFEKQKLLALRARDVITILDARIILLRRTIDFYAKSKEASQDINKMMRRLQIDQSLQSVQFVANELEFKDVSSVVASGATILSELQQLQLAQQSGQRSRIINLNLITIGIRSIIDQLNQDLAHLKTVLNQRKMILMNEDTNKMVSNFKYKCNQLQFWLNNHIKTHLYENNRLVIHNNMNDLHETRNFINNHEKLRVELQNKTLEVEALLRSLPTLMEHFDMNNPSNSRAANEIQQQTDCLRQDWISSTNCLDKRLELVRKYLSILQNKNSLDKELAQLNEGGAVEEDQIRSRQNLIQLENQVRNFNSDAQKFQTELPASDQWKQRNDINKYELLAHLDRLLKEIQASKEKILNFNDELIKQKVQKMQSLQRPAHERPQQMYPPRFTRILQDTTIEPFSVVELECETDSRDECKIEWFMNNFKKIPANVKHSIVSENNLHKLIIQDFTPVCCGTYICRASNAAGQATSHCKLRLSGIQEDSSLPDTTTASEQQAISRQMDRLIQGANLKQQNLQSSSDNNQSNSTTSVKITQVTTSDSESESILASNQKLPNHNSNYLHPNQNQPIGFIDSPDVSSTTNDQLTRSISRSPFDGTPQPPAFVQGLQDSLPHCHSRAGLICLVVGNPPPTIEWLHNDQLIAKTKCPKPADKSSGSLCKLTIETKNPHAQGQYVCKASNRIGETSQSITIAK